MGKRKRLQGTKRITKYSASELNVNRTLSLITTEARIPKKAKKIDVGKK